MRTRVECFVGHWAEDEQAGCKRRRAGRNAALRHAHPSISASEERYTPGSAKVAVRIAALDDKGSPAQLQWQASTGSMHELRGYAGVEDLLAGLAERFDLLVLDWNPPDLTGLNLLQRVRAGPRPHIPVIMLISMDREEDIAQALSSGADDVIVKPVRSQELLARIDAVTRPRRSGKRRLLDFGSSLRLDIESRLAWVDGIAARLSIKDFDLAVYLLSNQGSVIGRRQLLDAVWKDQSLIDSRTLDTHVSRVRQRLGLVSPAWHLEALYGHGYRLRSLALG